MSAVEERVVEPEKKKKLPPAKTLTLEKLIEVYNYRFEIEEEIGVLEQTAIIDPTKRIAHLNMELDYIDNIIILGERDYTRKNHANVRRLFIVFKNLRLQNKKF